MALIGRESRSFDGEGGWRLVAFDGWAQEIVVWKGRVREIGLFCYTDNSERVKWLWVRWRRAFNYVLYSFNL